MWLFYVYMGETVFVWVESAVHQIRLDKRLKKEGYIFTGNKYFSIADIFLGLGVLVVHSIPVFNLIIPLSHINFHQAYDEYKNYLLDAGAIEEPDEELKENDNNRMNKNVKEIHETIDKTFNQEKPKKIFYQPQNRDNIEDKKGYSYKKIFK